MIHLRLSGDRGFADHGWLVARHSFSFADYYDPAHMGWGALRVINEDRIRPGAGFGRHGHRDMEIVTYLLAGELEHQDSLGHGGVIKPGEVQRMSAGRGILHSEFNPSDTTETHLLQIWIEPAAPGGSASYEQAVLPIEAGGWARVAGPVGSGAVTTIGQDALLLAARPRAGESLAYPLALGRLGYLHVVRGSLMVNGHLLQAGDAAKIADESDLQLLAGEDSECLFFDLPPTA